jgi:hypothetical protein
LSTPDPSIHILSLCLPILLSILFCIGRSSLSPLPHVLAVNSRGSLSHARSPLL